MSAKSGAEASPVQVPAQTALPKRLNDFVCWLQQPTRVMWGGLLLLAALYIRTTGFDFVYDDHQIPGGPRLDSWKVVFDLFRHDIFGSQGNAMSVYFRPLSSLAVLVVKQLSDNPAWFHLAAVGIHLCLFYLAYVLGRLLLRNERLAAFAALLFALHPGKVETVAWVSSALCDGVGAIFFFSVLICYLLWQQRKAAVWLALSLLCFAAAVFTKETLFVVALLVLVHYCWSTERGQRVARSAALAAPYMAVLAGYMICRHAVLQAPSEQVGAVRPGFKLEGLWNAPLSFWWYVRHLVWPTPIGVMYDFSNVSGPSVRLFVLPLLGLVVLAAVGGWLWYRSRSANTTLLGAWFLLTLAAYVAFSPMVRLHDRYLHLASYPFCVLAAWLILRAGKAGGRSALVRVSALVLLCGLWATLTWRESEPWRNDNLLWQHATLTAPGMVEPWLHVAGTYSGNLGSMRAVQVIDEGLKHRPVSPALWQERGLLLYDRAQYAPAKSAFLKVIEVAARYDLRRFPDVLEAKTGAAYYLSLIEMRSGDYSGAERWARRAVTLKPDTPEFHEALGAALARQGKLEEAAREGSAGAVRSGIPSGR